MPCAYEKVIQQPISNSFQLFYDRNSSHLTILMCASTFTFSYIVYKIKFHSFITLQANPRMTLFTGSSKVAEKLTVVLKGRIKLEDAGFDWKILGPDVQEVSYEKIEL